MCTVDTDEECDASDVDDMENMRHDEWPSLKKSDIDYMHNPVCV